MLDVLIVGAGPAGSVAGAILARGGARVRIVDRAAFPRDKLCGDTVNPGTLARLRSLNLADGIDQRSLRVDGMRVTGEGGVAIEGRYPDGVSGRAIRGANSTGCCCGRRSMPGVSSSRGWPSGARSSRSGDRAVGPRCGDCGRRQGIDGARRGSRLPLTVVIRRSRSVSASRGIRLVRAAGQSAGISRTSCLGGRTGVGPQSDPRVWRDARAAWATTSASRRCRAA